MTQDEYAKEYQRLWDEASRVTRVEAIRKLAQAAKLKREFLDNEGKLGYDEMEDV